MQRTLSSSLVAACVIAASSVSAPARAQMMVSGFDGMTSTVMQEGQSSFSGLALRMRLKSPLMVQQLEIMPTIEYWRNSSTVNPYDIRTTRKDATLGVDARWNFVAGTWRPYLGAGYGIHFLSSRVTAPGLGIQDASDSIMKGGLAALGGLSFGLTDRFDNFIDLKYHHVTDYRQFKINWGLAYNIK